VIATSGQKDRPQIVASFDADCKLMLVTNNPHVIDQIDERIVTEAIDIENVYQGTEFVGATVRQAYANALKWVAEQTAETGAAAPEAWRSRPDDLPTDQLAL
jgi:hypothetical protein